MGRTKKYRECVKKGKEKAVRPTKRKAQQKKRAVKEVQRTFKMLKEVWLDIGIERTDTHKGITIKVLLDSGAIGIFMDRKTAAKHGFRLQKLKRLVRVKNIDGTYNSRGAIMHEVEVNVYYKSYIERMRMNVRKLNSKLE